MTDHPAMRRALARMRPEDLELLFELAAEGYSEYADNLDAGLYTGDEAEALNAKLDRFDELRRIY